MSYNLLKKNCFLENSQPVLVLIPPCIPTDCFGAQWLSDRQTDHQKAWTQPCQMGRLIFVIQKDYKGSQLPLWTKIDSHLPINTPCRKTDAPGPCLNHADRYAIYLGPWPKSCRLTAMGNILPSLNKNYYESSPYCFLERKSHRPTFHPSAWI